MKILKEKKFYLLAFIFPLILWSIILLVEKGFPFGNNSLASSDAYSQYTLFGHYIATRILNRESLTYTMSFGLGSPLLPLIAYYILSPFNLLYLIFYNVDANYIFNIIVVLKICLSCVTFYHVLSKTYKKEKTELVVWSLLYSFCGYVSTFYINVMWLDGFLLFPLIYYYLNVFLKNTTDTKSKIKYCILLTIAIFSNFYIGYEICIMIILIFVLNIINDRNNFWNKFKNIAIYSFIAVFNNLFLLFYACKYLISNSIKEGLLATPTKILDILNSFTIGYTPSNFLGNQYILIYIGIIGLMSFILYFFNKKISKQDKINMIIMIALLLAFYFIPSLNYVIHGFDYPTGFYNRFVFMFSFYFILELYKVIEKRNEIERKHVVITTLILSGIYLIIFILNFLGLGLGINSFTIFASECFLILYAFTLRNNKNYIYIIIAIEVFLNLFYCIQHRGLTEIKEDTYFYVENDSEYARTELDNVKQSVSSKSNSWALSDIDMVSCFSSSINTRLSTFMYPLGLTSGASSIHLDTYNYFLLSMFGVDTLYSVNDIDSEFFTETSENTYSYNYPLSIGYAINTNISNINLYKTYSSDLVSANNDLFYRLTGVSDPLLTKVELESTNAENSVTYTIDKDYDNLTFGKASNNMDFYLNDVFIENGFEKTFFNLKKGDKVTLSHETNLIINKKILYTLNEDAFKKGYNVLKKTQMQIDDYSDTYIKGSIDAPSNGTCVLLTISCNDGWTCYVDGKETEMYEVDGAIYEIILTKGNHTIEMKYSANYSLFIIILNILSLITTLVLFIKIYRKK